LAKVPFVVRRWRGGRIDDRDLDVKTAEVIFGLIQRLHRTQRLASGFADYIIYEDRMEG
jgi:hypothetical protein